MKYWLTTHWPPIPQDKVQYPLRVWIEDGKESVGRSLATGDRVLVYETKYGPPRRVTGVSGSARKVASIPGRQGIVSATIATGALAKDASFEKFIYDDGSQRWWCWHAPLQATLTKGLVPRMEVNRVLGYKPGYVFRGFGARGSGLKEITKTQYSELVELYELSTA